MDIALNLAPLLSAPLAIRIHAFAAIAAFAVGIVQLAGPKGTHAHRLVGSLWAVLMFVVALSSFWVHEIRTFGQWSPIHLLSILVLVSLPFAVLLAHRGKVRAHARAMTGMFLGALVIAGLFTFLPGRIMHAVLFGP